jgi:hypothetical protein
MLTVAVNVYRCKMLRNRLIHCDPSGLWFSFDPLPATWDRCIWG